ncbi:MAG: nitrilase-related carbon-nitrogen hydrolase, partial [Planctomycetota bacterium]
MSEGIIHIATCQFPVSADVEANASHIRDQMQQAADAGADIVHFPECALSGYASVDFESFAGYDWDLLKDKTTEIIELAGQLKLWAVLGSSHRL